VQTVTKQDLAGVVTLFNDAAARQFFATAKPVLQPDGSALSITFTQNSFSMSFASQEAFSVGAAKYPRALGRAALDLFRKAGIVISKDKLY
jgi:hypothetical protein